MQGEEPQEQRQVEAQPDVLGYAVRDPIPPQWASFLSMGIILSLIHLCISIIVLYYDRVSLPRLFWRIWFAPLFIVRWILRPVYPSGNDAIYMIVWEVLGTSLLYGFIFALIIHWLNRWRMRQR